MGKGMVSIYWEGQTPSDWDRYKKRKIGLVDLFMEYPLLALAFPGEYRRPEVKAQADFCEALRLRALDLSNMDPLTATPTTSPYLWAPPDQVAGAAERLATALGARDPGAWQFVEMQNMKLMDPSGRIPAKDRIPDSKWDELAEDFRQLAKYCRVLAEDGIPLITFDLATEGYAAENSSISGGEGDGRQNKMREGD